MGSMVASKGSVFRPVMETLLNMGACSLDFFFVNQFEGDRAIYWSALGCSLVRGPVLFLYSDSDELMEASSVDSFSALLRKKGREVWKKKWRDSNHVAHYQKHNQEYAEKVEAFLTRAIEVWRSGIADGEGLQSILYCNMGCVTVCSPWPSFAGLYHLYHCMIRRIVARHIPWSRLYTSDAFILREI